MSTPVQLATARLGVASRWGSPADVAAARQALVEAKLTRSIDEATSGPAPLNASARERLAHRLMAVRK